MRDSDYFYVGGRRPKRSDFRKAVNGICAALRGPAQFLGIGGFGRTRAGDDSFGNAGQTVLIGSGFDAAGRAGMVGEVLVTVRNIVSDSRGCGLCSGRSIWLTELLRSGHVSKMKQPRSSVGCPRGLGALQGRVRDAGR